MMHHQIAAIRCALHPSKAEDTPSQVECLINLIISVPRLGSIGRMQYVYSVFPATTDHLPRPVRGGCMKAMIMKLCAIACLPRNNGSGILSITIFSPNLVEPEYSLRMNIFHQFTEHQPLPYSRLHRSKVTPRSMKKPYRAVARVHIPAGYTAGKVFRQKRFTWAAQFLPSLESDRDRLLRGTSASEWCITVAADSDDFIHHPDR